MTSSPFAPVISEHYEPRWDWYELTVEPSARAASEMLFHALPPDGHWWGVRTGQPRNGYTRAFEIRDGDRTVIKVDGNGTEAMGTHIVVTGSDAHDLVPLLREVFPAGRCSRADVAYDFPGGAEGFQVACDALRLVASLRRVKGLLMLPDVAAEGRTYYLGAKTSETRGRLYEKGRKDFADTNPDLVRWETQVRANHPERKTYVAQASPRDVAGYTPWSRQALELLFGDGTSSPAPRQARRGDAERFLDWLADMAGKRLVEISQDHAEGATGTLVDLWEKIAARWIGTDVLVSPASNPSDAIPV